MIIDWLLDNLLPILTILGGAIAWLVDRRKRKAQYKAMLAENKQAEANALKGMQDVYDKFVEDVKLQIDTLRKENTFLKEKVKELERELKDSSNEREALSEQIKSFKEQSEKDTKLIGQLKRKVEGYEKELKIFRKERE